MERSNALLVTLVGVLLILNMANVVDVLSGWAGWTLAIIVLLIGLGQMSKNCCIVSTKKKKRK